MARQRLTDWTPGKEWQDMDLHEFQEWIYIIEEFSLPRPQGLDFEKRVKELKMVKLLKGGRFGDT